MIDRITKADIPTVRFCEELDLPALRGSFLSPACFQWMDRSPAIYSSPNKFAYELCIRITGDGEQLKMKSLLISIQTWQ